MEEDDSESKGNYRHGTFPAIHRSKGPPRHAEVP